MAINVLVADDHLLSRKGITSILAANSLFQIVGEAANGREAVNMAQSLNPDLILMDIRMPVLNGLEATQEIKTVLPCIKIVILSISEDVQDFFEAIKKGAQGYLTKNMEPDYWIDYLTSIVQGETPVSRELAAKILKTFSSEKPILRDCGLSEREQEVLLLVSEGLGNKEIGLQLYITESTVKNHLRNILNKLQLENRSQLIAFAYKNGFL